MLPMGQRKTQPQDRRGSGEGKGRRQRRLRSLASSGHPVGPGLKKNDLGEQATTGQKNQQEWLMIGK